MKISCLSCYALGLCAAAVMLAGCGAPPGATPSTIGKRILDGAGAPKYRVLFSFGRYNGRHGRNPVAPLCYLNGTLYGTTAYGGNQNGIGVIFGITTTGKFKVLHVLTAGPGGNEPYNGLTAVHSRLYGTTSEGGTYGYGAIYRMSTTGKYRTLYSFNFPVSDPCNGSAGPVGTLIDVNGTMYGTSIAGGCSDYGTVYSVSTQGDLHTLHYFSGSDGASPGAGLINVKGALYGTTTSGGAHNKGTVFRISTAGSEQVLFSFDGADGAHPVAPLIAIDGKLYGTTLRGGSSGWGTVFSMTMNGKEEAVLHSFSYYNGDGVRPAAGLIDVNGILYSTTAFGGIYAKSALCHAYGCGTIFSITTSGKETVVHRFQDGYQNDGSVPEASLVEANGRLYGTTEYGGYSTPKCPSYPCYYGTVFELRP